MKKINRILTPNSFTRLLTRLAVVALPIFNVAAQPIPPLKVTLTPSDPTWQLALNNTLLSPSEVQIEPTERSFARQLQPLLQGGEYQQVAELFNSRNNGKNSLALNLLQAQVLLTLKQFNDAEAAYLSCLQQSPNLIKAHQGLSLLYMQQGQYQKAQKHLIHNIELGQADAQSYAQLGYIHVQQNKPWSAIAAYRQALMLTPNTAQYQQGLLFALIESGDLRQANVLLQELLNADPNNADLWLQRSQIALQIEDQAQALSAIEVALKLNPKDTSNLLLAAQLHLSKGSAKRAVALLQQSLKSKTINTQSQVISTTMQTLGWLVAQQKWQLAQSLIRSAKPITKKLAKPEQAQFSVYSAQLAMAQGNTRTAVNSLTKALEINPTLGDALLSLASIYRNKKQLTQARLMYVRAQAIPQFELSAWLGLAQIAIDSKDYSNALKQLRKAFNSYPERQDLVTNIRALENLVRQQG
ncbi:tetratricopeptide repeat protein [Pseudoalteromonas sp. MMG010]|uniref:tetratricopeptide repeat protein n=1 Tax=Pseudoalteromonas sp. MMG010 TaxID=2822685 RepID=UPI001B3A675D|nr:tetratricopeptide repeat protein [Pseudoalteromonas sp. MMG010]MBQ4832765.1 tetratricopeptide repeat protein [Pseudoalteromonas sp. MMG010]